MSGPTTTYDPAKMLLTFLGSLIDGYMDGTFITVDRDEDAFSLKVGADGEKARARNNNKAGKIVVTLMQSSPSNDILSGYAASDELDGSGIGPIMLRDVLGTTLASCPDAYLSKVAKIERGKEILGTEWTFTCPALSVFAGGSIPLL